MSDDGEETPDFELALNESLDLIDRELAERGMPLARRPLSAALDFVRYFVTQVDDGKSGGPFEPGEFKDFYASEWFKVIYARTVAWYAGRYGKAMDREPERTMTGCILALGTPFAIRVPLVTRRPGTPGETIWVCFPDRVEPDEDALAWVEDGPNMTALPRGDGMKARRLADEVANALRAITVGIMTITGSDPRVKELRDQILTHLEGAAGKIARARPEDLKHAHWDMQMACELALKMLAQQRAGTFAESHDLYHLYDQLPPGQSPFERIRLAQLPRWDCMAEWRYGGGQPISVAKAFSRYRATLRIVRGVVEVAIRKYRIGGSRFEIRRAPFLHDDPDMFKPVRAPVART